MRWLRTETDCTCGKCIERAHIQAEIERLEEARARLECIKVSAKRIADTAIGEVIKAIDTSKLRTRTTSRAR